MKHLRTFKQLNENIVRDIPRLADDATWEDIESYLKWLKNSSYGYHIDDDPGDIQSFDKSEQEVLRHNSNVMWGFNDRAENKNITDKEMMNMLWDAYVPDDEHFANESEEKPKAMSDMSTSEKIAAYRQKISDERKKAAPSSAKLTGYNDKIAEIEAKKKAAEKKK